MTPFNPDTTKRASITVYGFLWIAVIISSIFFLCGERRAVTTHTALLPFKLAYKPVSCENSPSNDGELIHIDCPLRNLPSFYPPPEFLWNLRPFRGIFLEMKVEMYQWVIPSKGLGFYYVKDWVSHLIDSTRLFLSYTSHSNPDFFPQVNGAGRRFGAHIVAGSYQLSRRHIIDFHNKKQLPLLEDGHYTPSLERPPTTISYANTQVHKDALYTGNPESPQIGDVRITFWGSTVTHVSIIAKQQRHPRNRLAQLAEYSYDGKSNQTINELIFEGDYTPEEMFQLYGSLHEGTLIAKRIRRCIVWVLLTLLLIMSYRLIYPETGVAILPLIIGASFIAIGIMMLLIAPCWIIHDNLLVILWGIPGLCLLSTGCVIWKLGKQFSDRFPQKSVSDDLPDMLLNKRQQINDYQPINNQVVTKSKHYYQPV